MTLILVFVLVVIIPFSIIPSIFGQGQAGFDRIKRLADELKNTARQSVILEVIDEYQKETGEYNISWLSIDQIINKIQQWYDTTEPKPEMTKEVIIDKYKEIINSPPPQSKLDERLDLLFNN